jgi:hypothetical protein
MAATNKQLLICESRDDSNRCTPCRGKPDQHDTYASHASPCTPGVRFLWRSLYVATFHTNPTELDRFTAPEKKCSRLHLLAWLSGPRDPPQFLSQHSHWSSALKPNIYRQQATRFTGPISLACGGYVQYLLTGTNPRSLTNTGGGYHIENFGIATTLSLPFPLEVSTDPPNGPIRSQIIQQYLPIELERGTCPKSRE